MIIFAFSSTLTDDIFHMIFYDGVDIKAIFNLIILKEGYLEIVHIDFEVAGVYFVVLELISKSLELIKRSPVLIKGY